MPTDTAVKAVPKSTPGNKVRIIDAKHRIVIDEDRHEILIDGAELHVAPKEFKVLLALKLSGKTMTRAEIMRQVWPAVKGRDIDERTVDQHIARLRRKISSRGILGSSVIKTQNSFGYVYRPV